MVGTRTPAGWDRPPTVAFTRLQIPVWHPAPMLLYGAPCIFSFPPRDRILRRPGLGLQHRPDLPATGYWNWVSSFRGETDLQPPAPRSIRRRDIAAGGAWASRRGGTRYSLLPVCG